MQCIADKGASCCFFVQSSHSSETCYHIFILDEIAVYKQQHTLSAIIKETSSSGGAVWAHNVDG